MKQSRLLRCESKEIASARRERSSLAMARMKVESVQAFAMSRAFGARKPRKGAEDTKAILHITAALR